MKPEIHPDYHYVVFQDASTGKQFLTRSTVRSQKKIKWEDGNEYPLVTMDVTSDSHPFYTGEQRIVDTAGQVDRFMRRLQTAQSRQADAAARRQPREQPKKRSLYQEVFGEDEQAATGGQAEQPAE
jgi:large subunit ribosomal protein L31